MVLTIEVLGCDEDGETYGVTLVLVTVNSRMDDCGGQNMVLSALCPSRRPLAQCCNVFIFGVLYKSIGYYLV